MIYIQLAEESAVQTEVSLYICVITSIVLSLCAFVSFSDEAFGISLPTVLKELCLCWLLNLKLSSTVSVPGITSPLTFSVPEMA